MRLPITDKFLFDLYNFIEEIDKTFDLFTPWPSINKVCYLDFYRLKQKYRREKTSQQFSQFIYYLKKKGYIKIKNLEHRKGIIFTRKGAEKVLKIKLKSSEKKKRRDGRWQMIVFDIPEEKRHLRDILRENLYFLKYQMLQKSIWVCPYDVSKETEGVLRKYSLDQYVKLFLIEEIEI